jgi:predicted neutral ceramidase superfamily lipid hydrolase
MRKILKHIKDELKTHFFDYLLFVTAGVFFLIALNIFKGEQLLQFIILLAFVSFYIIWGIYHHAFTKTLHFKIVLEYVLLGFIILFFIKLLLFS